MKVLWIPIFSMRSYETDMYSITKDGNFQLTLSRILASDFDHITVSIPNMVSDINQYLEMMKMIGIKFPHKNIDYIQLIYGKNAVETRKSFWVNNRDFFYNESILDYDLVITDITGYSGSMSFDLPFINNFNITKLPNLVRPYIDDFFNIDLVQIKQSIFTTVINKSQKEYITKIDPSLENKIFVYNKLAHEYLLPVNNQINPNIDMSTIFWPFRISDSAYKFNEFIEMFEKNNLNLKYSIIITDPNDTYTLNKNYIHKIKMSKKQYYETLQNRPIIIMLDNIDDVFHPGTVEFMFYNCNMITFKNSLIIHDGMIKSLDDIPQKLNKIRYNRSFHFTDFVYSHNEISKIYSKEYIKNFLQIK
jgi:hypothetical protein